MTVCCILYVVFIKAFRLSYRFIRRLRIELLNDMYHDLFSLLFFVDVSLVSIFVVVVMFTAAHAIDSIVFVIVIILVMDKSGGEVFLDQKKNDNSRNLFVFLPRTCDTPIQTVQINDVTSLKMGCMNL